MQTIKNLKGVTLGTIEVTNGLCVVRWSSGEVMGLRGPAVIIFNHGKDTLLLAFDGEKIIRKSEGCTVHGKLASQYDAESPVVKGKRFTMTEWEWLPVVTANPKDVVSEVKTRKTPAKK
jgi:hypothetical protein